MAPQTTSISAHIVRKFPPRGHLLPDGGAVLALGSTVLPVDVFPEDPAHLFLIGEEAIRLAHEWNDRTSQRETFTAAERRRYRRLSEDETPATERDLLHDDGLDAVTPEDVAFG